MKKFKLNNLFYCEIYLKKKFICNDDMAFALDNLHFDN
jgi:hypothetical protein